MSAKRRLGFDDDHGAEDCDRAFAAGCAHQLVVHGHTHAQGDKPSAYWARLADVRSVVNIPAVANGEIWTVADVHRCRAESGSQDSLLTPTSEALSI